MSAMPKAAPHEALRRVMRDSAVLAGERVHSERLARGLGPTVFCALIGVPLQTLHKIEGGEIVPRDHLKAAIALALEMELGDLWGWPTIAEIEKRVKKVSA